MKSQLNNVILLRYRCPVCQSAIATREFSLSAKNNAWLGGKRFLFQCADCRSPLKIREKYYRYHRLFCGCVMAVTVLGFLSVFFVDDAADVTRWMLSAVVICTPLLVLAVVNNKAEVATDEA